MPVMSGTSTKLSRAVLGLCMVLGCAVAGTVFAGPDEDYRKGVEAYQRDDLMGAMQRLRSAAREGHAPAQALLAYVLDLAEENEEAFDFYRKAADQGNADGMYGLGNMYANGDGIEQNDEQAVHWYTRAAEAGHDHAVVVLAEAYLKGSLGLSPDRDKALEWLERGIARGYEPARERLSRVSAAQ